MYNRGHELRVGMLVGEGAGQSRIKRKKWDNCNSIINKIHVKQKRRRRNECYNGIHCNF